MPNMSIVGGDSDNVIDRFYAEVVRRLEKPLGAWLSLDECLVLTHILNFQSFEWSDGFSTDEGPLLEGVGGSTAALVAAAFCNTPMDGNLLYIKYEKGDSGPLRHMIGGMMYRILSDPDIRPKGTLLPGYEPLEPNPS
jgi:hypothetical protein